MLKLGGSVGLSKHIGGNMSTTGPITKLIEKLRLITGRTYSSIMSQDGWELVILYDSLPTGTAISRPMKATEFARFLEQYIDVHSMPITEIQKGENDNG